MCPYAAFDRRLGPAQCELRPARVEKKATLAGVPILDQAPSCPAELSRRCRPHPDMAAFARDAEVIDTGLQPLVYGEHLPLGPPLPRRGPSRCPAAAQARLHRPDRQLLRPGRSAAPRGLPGPLHPPARPVLLRQDLPRGRGRVLLDPGAQDAGARGRRHPRRSAGSHPEPAGGRGDPRKVQAGCGLVLLPVARWGGGGQFGYWPTTDKMEAWKDSSRLWSSPPRRRAVSQHAVTSTDGLWDGVPWSLLPPTTWPACARRHRHGPGQGRRAARWPWADRSARAARSCCPGARTWAASRWPRTTSRSRSATTRSTTPAPSSARLLWAANRPSPVALSLVADSSRPPGSDKRAVQRPAPPERPRSAAGCRARRRQAGVASARPALPGPVESTGSPAAGVLEVDLPALAGGDYLLDAIARDGQGNSLGWGTWVVSAEAQGA